MPLPSWIVRWLPRNCPHQRRIVHGSRRALNDVLDVPLYLTRLEERRVLSVTVGLEGGELAVAIAGDDTATISHSGSDLIVSRSSSAEIDTFLASEVTSLRVTGDAGETVQSLMLQGENLLLPDTKREDAFANFRAISVRRRLDDGDCRTSIRLVACHN